MATQAAGMVQERCPCIHNPVSTSGGSAGQQHPLRVSDIKDIKNHLRQDFRSWLWYENFPLTTSSNIKKKKKKTRFLPKIETLYLVTHKSMQFESSQIKPKWGTFYKIIGLYLKKKSQHQETKKSWKTISC